MIYDVSVRARPATAGSGAQSGRERERNARCPRACRVPRARCGPGGCCTRVSEPMRNHGEAASLAVREGPCRVARRRGPTARKTERVNGTRGRCRFAVDPRSQRPEPDTSVVGETMPTHSGHRREPSLHHKSSDRQTMSSTHLVHDLRRPRGANRFPLCRALLRCRARLPVTRKQTPSQASPSVGEVG